MPDDLWIDPYYQVYLQNSVSTHEEREDGGWFHFLKMTEASDVHNLACISYIIASKH